jgi:hypothetical protein
MYAYVSDIVFALDRHGRGFTTTCEISAYHP